MIEVWVPGEPKPKARPRVFYNKAQGTSHAYTPQSTSAYHRYLMGSFDMHLLRHPEQKPYLAKEPLVVQLEFRLQIPMSQSIKWQQKALAGKVLPTKKPDLDNLEKAILDAANLSLWGDDSQIVQLTSRKVWAMEPGVMIRVRRMEGVDIK